MAAAYPIPADALDRRLAFTGTSGSGKTYSAGTAVERLLDVGARCVIIDPLGVWWGLRLRADGKRKSKFDLPIFGGAHGDLPINEHAGALIGETVAGMAESCILSLEQMPSHAAERRFMLAFLTALHKHHRGAPLHLILDEVDEYCPQQIMDRDGDAMKLKGTVDRIVRRGRVKGFIPWLITQRPAVVDKNILSQADGLVAFALTSSQDRAALGAWIEGQADRAQGRETLASLPSLRVGEAVVWLPRWGILKTEQFPTKVTFDSSRTPERGETLDAAPLAPLDLGALKDRLAGIEADAKANDPRALKAEVERLKRELAAKPAAAAADTDRIQKEAYADGYQAGWKDGDEAGRRQGHIAGQALALTRMRSALDALKVDDGAELPPATITAAPAPAPAKPRTSGHKPPAPEPRQAPIPAAKGGDISGPQRQMLAAIAWWRAMGHEAPSRAQVAAIAGWRITSGHLKNVAGSLRTKGLIDYPEPGAFALTAEGVCQAPEPDMSLSFHDRLRSTLTGPQAQVFDYLLKIAGTVSRDTLAEACGWSPTSGHVKNVLGSMRTLEIIDYPTQGFVDLQTWVRSA